MKLTGTLLPALALLALARHAAALQVRAFLTADRETDMTQPQTIHAGGPRVFLAGDTSDFGMPLVGFGTCCRLGASGAPLAKAVVAFLAAGGRAIDTAQLYENQKDIGTALRQSGVPREEVWITTKLSPLSMNSAEEAAGAIATSIAELGTPYVDLMLLHMPGTEGLSSWVRGYQALLAAKEEGKVRHVGVSNFNREQIASMQAAGLPLPEANQVEFHPFVCQEQKALVAWLQSQHIQPIAYASLGGAQAPRDSVPELLSIASKHKASTAQVLLRWAVDQGVAVIPGTNSPTHIKQNVWSSLSGATTLPDVKLSSAEHTAISSLASRHSAVATGASHRWGPKVIDSGTGAEADADSYKAIFDLMAR